MNFGEFVPATVSGEVFDDAQRRRHSRCRRPGPLRLDRRSLEQREQGRRHHHDRLQRRLLVHRRRRRAPTPSPTSSSRDTSRPRPARAASPSPPPAGRTFTGGRLRRLQGRFARGLGPGHHAGHGLAIGHEPGRPVERHEHRHAAGLGVVHRPGRRSPTRPPATSWPRATSRTTRRASGNLAAGASATQQYAFSLPNGDPGVGQIQFTVTADYDQNVSTPAGEPNDTATLTETSTLGPYPELVPSDVTATRHGRPGRADVRRLDPDQQRIGQRHRALDRAGPAGDRCGGRQPDPAGRAILYRLARGRPVGLSVDQRADPQLCPRAITGSWSARTRSARSSSSTPPITRRSRPSPRASRAGLTLTLAYAAPRATPPVPTRRRPRSPATPTRRMRSQVTIANSDPTDVTVPQTVTIPAGATSVTFAGRHDQQPCRRGHPDGDADGQRHGRSLGQRHAHRHRHQRAHADRGLEQSHRQRDRHQSGDLRHGHAQHPDDDAH